MDEVLELSEDGLMEAGEEEGSGVDELDAQALAEAGEAVRASSVVDDADEFAELRAHFEGEGLSDAELDLIADLAVSYVRQLLAFFGEDHVTIEEYEGDDDELILDISEGDLAVLIGRHGRTLDALQMVVTSLMSSRLHFYYPIVIDIEGYKGRRREKLESLARSAAVRAKRQRRQIALAPMNAYERRLVHLALVDDVEVSTHSEGDEPYRRVVVTYVRG